MDTLVFNINVFGSILLLLVSGVFIFSQLKKDNSIMDIVYGPLFLISGLLTLLLTNNTPPLSLIIIAAIGIWSLRLSIRIFKKNYGAPEDARYANWRQLWSQKGKLYFVLRSYYQINLLQGIIILFVSFPFIISLNSDDTYNPVFAGLGILVFVIGLAIESLADYQLDKFIAGKKAGLEKATLMTTGLFRYSRRPNYFGETLIWWGLAITVLPLPFGYLALISPLLITYIVTKVTGPMLEAIFLQKYPNEYKEYMKKTSYFFPLPPRR
jgi:steroid 5-alpha reductase family enzyme